MTRRTAVRAATPARKAAILEAALTCFTEHGIEATTIDDIRQASEASTGSLYHHFGSKEGIASALFIDGIGRLNADLMRRLQRCKNAEQSVRMVVIQYCDWVTTHRDLARFLLHSRDIDFSAEAKDELRQMRRAHITRVFEWFAPYVANGEMKVLPVETYVPIISGPIQDYARGWLSEQIKAPPTKVKAVFSEAAWNGVKAG